jgi:hypothetical protein
MGHGGVFHSAGKVSADARLTDGNPPAEIDFMIRAIIDDRLRRVWVILIGMSVVAVTVGVVTIVIHDRMQ